MKAEEIEIPFGQQACVGARNHVGGHIGAITANSDLPDDDDGARHYVRLPYRARAEPAPPRRRATGATLGSRPRPSLPRQTALRPRTQTQDDLSTPLPSLDPRRLRWSAVLKVLPLTVTPNPTLLTYTNHIPNRRPGFWNSGLWE